MTDNSTLWDYASESIVRGIETLHKELGTGPDLVEQVETYTDACRSMALQGTVMREGSVVKGNDALSHWNGLYTNLQDSKPPSGKGESTCPAELLASRHLHLKNLTKKFMESGTDPAWVKDTIEAVGVDAISVRQKAISDMLRDVKALCSMYETNCTYVESKKLFRLSQAAKRYAARAQKVNGPMVNLITTGVGGKSHQGLDHYEASEFMGAMSYALRHNNLDPLTASPTFKQGNSLITSISDLVRDVETATNTILFAHQELNDTGEEQCDDPKGSISMIELDDAGEEQCDDPKGGISMTEEELCDAQLLYMRAVAAERRREKSVAASGR